LTEQFIKDIARGQAGFIPIVKNADIQGKSWKIEEIYWLDLSKEWEIPKNFISKDFQFYFGVFARNQMPKTKKTYGESYLCKTGKASFLWADIDNISPADAKGLIKGAGLPAPNYFINSGGGVHIYYLLDNPVDKIKITNLSKAIALKLKSDNSVCEFQKVMRLPNTKNSKYKDTFSQVVDYKKEYYSISLFEDILSSEMENITGSEKEIRLQKIQKEYNRVRNSCQFHCIKEMLSGVSKGERNNCLMRITAYLKYIAGLTESNARDFVLEWNNLNNPAENISMVKNTFKSIWTGDWKALLGCKFTNNLSLQDTVLKYCNTQKCERVKWFGFKDFENMASLPSRIFERIDKTTADELVILCLLKKETLSSQQLMEILPIKRNSFYNAINNLIKSKWVEVIKGNKKKKIPNFYKYNPKNSFYKSGKEQREIFFKESIIQDYIQGKLKTTESKSKNQNKSILKVYFLMQYLLQNRKPITENEISKMLYDNQKNRGNISRAIKELESMGYIVITKEHNSNGIACNHYTFIL